MKNFKTIQKETIGKVKIESNTQYNNIKADEVVISENVSARLYGNIKNSVTLKKGSKLYMHGTIDGVVKNEGGDIYIY
ncbi:MAG: hypothetical protein K0Q95_3017 [Bacteroidota bacterium]|jgi:hypothetical protein|nr:hypothetical protein [Bacteroidota bacterium]